MTNYIERYWRDAKPEDAIKEPPMVARFRIDKDDTWQLDTLQGFDRSIDFLWRGRDFAGRQCQVYDAPDPGHGWRLIDTDSDDYQQDGIEFWNRDKNTWMDRWACSGSPFVADMHYRRRITPAVTYVPFTWEDRDQLRGRWITQVETDGTEQMVNKLDLINGDLFANNKLALELLTGWRFLDTGEPVGKKVTQ